ncbi:MAG: RlpA-like double-psi beta-barrel domain-containing protein [Candidatus Sericytochromatia bacterium]
MSPSIQSSPAGPEPAGPAAKARKATQAKPAKPQVSSAEPAAPQESVQITRLPGKAEAPIVELAADSSQKAPAAKVKTPAKPLPPARSATVSAYGPGLYGNKTASGSRLTASTVGLAHKTLPLGTRVDVTVNGKTVSARVIDRGPYVGNREFDLTTGLIKKLGFASCDDFGVRKVSVRIYK